MIYRIFGGLFLTFTGLAVLGIYGVPNELLGASALIGGVALLAGK